MQITDIPIILSNLVSILPVAYGIKSNKLIQSLFLSFSGLISLIYHFLWVVNVNQLSFITRFYHTFLDYYHICLALIPTFISLYKIKNKKLETIIIIFFSGLFLTLNLVFSIFEPIDGEIQISDIISVGNKIVIILTIFIILFIGLITKFIIYKELPNYNFIYTILTLISLSLGIFFFMFDKNLIPYYIGHSLWHCFIFITPYFIFKGIDNEHNWLYYLLCKCCKNKKKHIILHSENNNEIILDMNESIDTKPFDETIKSEQKDNDESINNNINTHSEKSDIPEEDIQLPNVLLTLPNIELNNTNQDEKNKPRHIRTSTSFF
jgi:hypothetical protein